MANEPNAQPAREPRAAPGSDGSEPARPASSAAAPSPRDGPGNPPTDANRELAVEASQTSSAGGNAFPPHAWDGREVGGVAYADRPPADEVDVLADNPARDTTEKLARSRTSPPDPTPGGR